MIFSKGVDFNQLDEKSDFRESVARKQSLALERKKKAAQQEAKDNKTHRTSIKKRITFAVLHRSLQKLLKQQEEDQQHRRQQQQQLSRQPTAASNKDLESEDELLDHAAKWEGQPLTSIDDIEDQTAILDGAKEGQKEDEGPWYKDPKKFAKVMIPHILLISTLLSYTAVCAIILQSLETDREVAEKRTKMEKILDAYDKIVNDTWDIISSEEYDIRDIPKSAWKKELYGQLYALSMVHEDGPVPLNVSEIRTRWTFPSAVLYVLTILTTCGYDHVGPLTDIGKVFSVGFALVGIPLMFAADIGKFLSDLMMGCIRRVNRVIRLIKRKCCSRKTSMNQSIVSGSSKEADGCGGRKSKKDLSDMEFPFDTDDNELEYQSLWFPIGAYIGLICAYCAIGSMIYCHYEEGWWFIRGFHFSFNTIVTVGLGNIAVSGWIYLGLNIIYVIVGLAVVTMCVDLASTHLKAYFTRIHYFGRGLGVSDELREMMQLMMSLRKKKGGKVTWLDLQQLMIQRQNAYRFNRPFIPRNIHLWRYVDETSSSCTIIRQNSQSCSDLMSSSISSARRMRNNNNNNNPMERSTDSAQQFLSQQQRSPLEPIKGIDDQD